METIAKKGTFLHALGGLFCFSSENKELRLKVASRTWQEPGNEMQIENNVLTETFTIIVLPNSPIVGFLALIDGL